MNGLDLSYANNITFEKLKRLKTLYNIEFIILRLGYSTTLDDKVIKYVDMCKTLDLPFSFYHFSYAINAQKAELEAKFVNEQVKKFEDNPLLPIYFDFEYDSEKYYKEKNGYVIDERTYGLFYNIYKNIIEFDVGIYFNTDYYNKFRDVIQREPIQNRWIALGNKNLAAMQQRQMKAEGEYIDLNTIYDENLIGKVYSYYSQKGWIRKYNNWFYRSEDNTYKKGWIFDNDNYYYLDHSGAMITGLKSIVSPTGINELYYFSPKDGHMMRTNERGALK